MTSIVISAIIVAASGGTGLLGGTWLSSLGLGGRAMLAGAVSGTIMTGSWQGAMKGAIFGAFSAGVANAVVDATASMMSGVTSEVAHKATLLKAGMRGVGLTKSLLHGLSRGAINTLQGGTFKAGFASGFASSGFDVGTQGHGGFVGRTTIMGIVGGTASAIGGGKFSNGAISGAFVHMFNAEATGSVAINRKIQALLAGAKDGHLTLEEANTWYIYGKGKDILVDGTRLEYQLTGETTSNGNYRATVINDDYFVYGQVTVSSESGGIMWDRYDFDMQGNPIRDIPTVIGRAFAGPVGTPYTIKPVYDESWRNQ